MKCWLENGQSTTIAPEWGLEEREEAKIMHINSGSFFEEREVLNGIHLIHVLNQIWICIYIINMGIYIKLIRNGETKH